MCVAVMDFISKIFFIFIVWFVSNVGKKYFLCLFLIMRLQSGLGRDALGQPAELCSHS